MQFPKRLIKIYTGYTGIGHGIGGARILTHKSLMQTAVRLKLPR